MQMRRELAAAIRDVGKLAGHETVLAYMVKLVQGQHEEMKKLIREAGAATAAKLRWQAELLRCKTVALFYSGPTVVTSQ
jgi:hypothetical protein